MRTFKIEIPFINSDDEIRYKELFIKTKTENFPRFESFIKVIDSKIKFYSKYPDHLDLEWGDWLSARTIAHQFRRSWPSEFKFGEISMIAPNSRYASASITIAPIDLIEID